MQTHLYLFCCEETRVNFIIINQRLKNTLELQCCHYYLFGRTGLCAFSSLLLYSLLLSYFLILCPLMCVWTLGYCHCSFYQFR